MITRPLAAESNVTNVLYDLHTHTSFSDGSLSPRELLIAAAQSGITHLSVTDHDNDHAFIELVETLRNPSNGTLSKLTLISGIEFSTRWQSTDIHVLALNFTFGHEAISALIEKQREVREQRNAEILGKLTRAGIKHSFETKLQTLPQAGRVHIANLLVEDGYAKNRQQAFKRYLGRSGKAYVQSHWVSLPKIIETTHEAGGVTVLAHPLKYQLTRTKLKAMIADYAAMKGDAIEVISGRQALTETSAMADLASEFELSASLGSDFHSPNQTWCSLGCAGHLPPRCRPVWADWPV